MEARQKYQAEYGKNIYSHDNVHPHIADQNERTSNTFKSSINFQDKGSYPASIDVMQKKVRDRQFNGNPIQPAATRQSYQDSDIFGTKGNSETVQKSANQYKEIRQRQSNTFARSNVIGNDEAALKQEDGLMHKPIARDENRWESNVFKGPQQETVNRKILAKPDAGKEGLWGCDDMLQTYQKKSNLASALSKKTVQKEIPKVQAEDRYAKEMYGNSAYKPSKKGDGSLMTSAADWRNCNQTYTNKKKEKPAPGLFSEEDRKDRKAAQLQSNLLTHEDDALREQRTAQFDKNGQGLKIASNAGWDVQNGYKKPVNSGKIDAYKMRQNQLLSNGVLEQNQYEEFMPIVKKKIDMDNFGKKQDDYGRTKKLSVDYSEKQLKSQNDQVITKKNELRATFDNHDYDQIANSQKLSDEYKEKMGFKMDKKQQFLASTILSHEAHKYADKKDNQNKIIDLDVYGLPENYDEMALKKISNAKHVIQSEVKQDNVKGTCTGEGRLKIRLNEGETQDQIKQAFLRAGFQVREHQDDPRKKPIVTGPPKDNGESKNLNAQLKKQHELRTKF